MQTYPLLPLPLFNIRAMLEAEFGLIRRTSLELWAYGIYIISELNESDI